MVSPLLGRGYLYLSQLCFLDGVPAAGAEQLVSQAYLVRPYDGHVWLTIGENAFLKGDIHKAFTFRRRAFHQDTECRDAIINGLAGQMPVTAFLQQFEPDELGLRQLLRFYTARGQQENVRVVAGFLADYMAQRAQSADGGTAANYWVRATLLYRMTGDANQTIACAAVAAKAAPTSLRIRRLYATELFRDKQWSLAIPELRWCLNRQPTDKEVKRMLSVAARTSQLPNSTSR
jgi:tetratricopeptide (TPR) repeat protein